MEPATLAAGLIGSLFLGLAIFPARTVYLCLRDGRQAEIGKAVFRSITRTAFGLGLPLLVGVLVLLGSDPGGGGGSGVMSKTMGLGLLLVLGVLALAGLWACALFVGFVAASVVRALPAPKAALLMALCMSLAPSFTAAVYAYEQAKIERERQHRQRWGR